MTSSNSTVGMPSSSRADALAEEMRASSAKSTKWNKRLPCSSSGGAALSRETMKLLDALAPGHRPDPLCDVVEVVEEDWQYAVEALLGRGREAIVDPSRLNEAFDLM